MAAGLITHNIQTAVTGGTFTFKSWVPDTTAQDVGVVPLAMLTDGTNVVALGSGLQTAALRITPASDAGTLTVLQGINNGGVWQIEGKPGGTGTLVPVHIDPTQISTLGQTTGSASVPVVQASDYGFPFATDKMVAGTTPLTPVFTTISAAATGPMVAAVTSKRIRVISLKLIAGGAVNVKWQSSATDITGLSYFSALGDGEVLPFNPLGWFQTAAGEALNINLSAAVNVGGHLTYVAV